MKKKQFFRFFTVCTMSAILAVQTPVAVIADEIAPVENAEQTENITEPMVTPEQSVTPEQTDPALPQEPDQENTEVTDEVQTEVPVEEEPKKEALPISAGISVSGGAGALTLVLAVTNGLFISENIPDFTAVFSGIPQGVSVQTVGQTENTITYHIFGNAAVYTKNDLVMVIPGNWLKDTADETVLSETPVDVHNLFWCAHADFGIRLKSKEETIDNAAFIAQQNLIENNKDYDTLHFVYKKTDEKFFSGPANILEYPAEDSRIVGKAIKDCSVYKIIDIQDGWVYVESGRVRGFVKAEQMCSVKKNKRDRHPITAKLTIPTTENKAVDYVRVTAYNLLVKEQPRISLKDVEIKEEMSAESRTIGTLKENGLVYWLSHEGDDWMYVESEDVRGFVKETDFLSVGDTDDRIEKEGTAGFAFAEKTVEPSDNKAFYYKLTSTKTGDMEEFYRNQIVELAGRYIGNPYVYGGTDPVNGIDCSAFMQFLFGTYGISLPRTSRDQGFVQKMIPLTSLDKGDMIIYADDAEIYHVVMYAGEGKTVEAADESQGICSKDVNKVAAVWGISLLDDTKDLKMPSEIGKPSYKYETQEEYEKSAENHKE